MDRKGSSTDSLVAIIERWEQYRDRSTDGTLNEFLDELTLADVDIAEVREAIETVQRFDSLSATSSTTLPELPGLKLYEQIGQGGMGKVFRAVQTSVGRDVAVKVISIPQGLDSNALIRFRQEAKSIARLNHPHIIRLFEFEDVDGTPFMVMEYAEQGSLTKYLRSVEFDEKKIAEFVQQIANAAHYAHQNGVIHRDLKPSNILIDKSGRPKIADFGLAKTLDERTDVTQPGAMIGTMEYMAPEQRSGEATVLSDVFGLGGILWWCLTGRPAIKVTRSSTGKVDYDPPDARSDSADLDRDLVTIALKCLRSLPGERYQSADEVSQDLGRYLSGRPIRARRVGQVERCWKTLRRHPIFATVVATFTVILIVLAAGAYRHVKHTRQRGQVESLLTALPDEVPIQLQRLQPTDSFTRSELIAALNDSPSDNKKARALLALGSGDQQWLRQYTLEAEADETLMAIQLMKGSESDLQAYRRVLLETSDDDRFIRAAVCLSTQWSDLLEEWIAKDEIDGHSLASRIFDVLDHQGPMTLNTWLSGLKPIRESLRSTLQDRFLRSDSISAGHCLVSLFDAEVPVDVDWDDTRRSRVMLLDALLDSPTPEHFVSLSPALRAISQKAQDKLQDYLQSVASVEPEQDASEEEKESIAKRRVNAVVALYRLGAPEHAWPLLKKTPDLRVRSLLIEALPKVGCDPAAAIESLHNDDKFDQAQKQGLLLVIGGYDPGRLSALGRTTVTDRLGFILQTEERAEIRSAAQWVLQRWNLKPSALQTRSESDVPSGANWFVTPSGHTMVVLPPATFAMGSRDVDLVDERDERRHWRKIGRSFAIGAREVTAAEFRQFLPTHRIRWSPTDNHPACTINYFGVAAYCNWLSDQEGIPRSEWCFLPNDDGKYADGMKVAPDVIDKRGYRIPTEAEWEYACRAGAITKYSFGQSEELLDEYGVIVSTNGSLPLPVGSRKPNLFGLFDMHGNAWEWCLEPYVRHYPEGTQDRPAVDRLESWVVPFTGNGVLRGGGSDRLAKNARCTHRWTMTFSRNPETSGFRLVRSVVDDRSEP